MKKLKSLLGLVLSFTLILGMSLSVSAETLIPDKGSTMYLNDLEVGTILNCNGFVYEIGDAVHLQRKDGGTFTVLIDYSRGGNPWLYFLFDGDDKTGIYYTHYFENKTDYVVWDQQFSIKQNKMYGMKDPEIPQTTDQIHNSHAEKAEMLPVKNTDGSYKLNAYGVPVIACSECGQVHADFAVAHEAWLDEVENAVKNHKNFGTDWKTKEEAAENPVTITTSTFISFDKDMLSYLNSQPDAVILKFKYQGKYFVTTIPSDFDCLSLADENGWAGFAYIMSICGGREITEEESKM